MKRILSILLLLSLAVLAISCRDGKPKGAGNTASVSGTKAGAVTMIAMAGNGVMPEPKYVYLDRPFIYMIVDNSTNLPVFIGYVLHPVAGK